MMVTPSIFMSGQTPAEKAVINPPVTIQRAVIVTQDSNKPNSSETKLKELADVDTKLVSSGNIDEKSALKQMGSNGASEITVPRTFGRQKRIIEPHTPSSTPVSQSSSNEESRPASGAKYQQASLKTVERITDFGSPDSPLSKMSIMLTPGVTPSGHKDLEGLLSPKR